MVGVVREQKPLVMLRGDGQLGLNDEKGVTRVSLIIHGGKGEVVIQDANGQAIRRLL